MIDGLKYLPGVVLEPGESQQGEELRIGIETQK
jgi:hypothetical protein